MTDPMRPRATYANVTASLALFVALGGTGYAVSQLPANSVGAKQLRRDAVRSPEVADRSLLARDFALGQLPAGPTGPPGSAKAYARVNAGGSLVQEQSKGDAIVQRVAPGRYCIGVTVQLGPTGRAASPVYTTPSNIIVTPIGEDAVTATATTERAAIDAYCSQAPSTGHVVVTVRDARTGAATDAGFYVAFN